jgi:hypothetical protein
LSEEEVITIQIDPEYINDLADFLEELNPPSKLRYYLIIFGLGVAGGIGLGLFLGWLWVRV